MVDGGDYGTGRRTRANNVSQGGVPRSGWSGDASSGVGGRAGTITNGEGRFLQLLLVKARNLEVEEYIPW